MQNTISQKISITHESLNRDKFITSSLVMLTIMTDESKNQTGLQMSRVRKYGLRLVIAFAVVNVLGFFALPPLVKYILVDQMSKALDRQVTIEDLRINPYKLSATVEGLGIREKESEEVFAGFDSLHVDLQASSLFRWGAVVREIKLANPRFHIVRVAENRYNFSDLLDKFTAEPKTEDAGSATAFSLNNIQISGGAVGFDDRLVSEKHAISDIELTLPLLSNMSYATDTFVEPHFSAQINGAPLEIQGKSKPFSDSMESEFALVLNGVELAKYFGYSPVKLPIKVASGALDVDVSLVFRQEGATPKLLLSGTTAVKNLKVNESSEQPLLSFKQLDVNIGSSDLLGGKFVINKVAVTEPEINTRVSSDGLLNWLELLPKEAVAAKSAEQTTAKAASTPPVVWSLAEVKVSDGMLHWHDESNAKTLKVDVGAINVALKNIDSQGSPIGFDAAWKVDGDPWLEVGSMTLKDGTLDLAQRRVQIGDAEVKTVRSLIRRSSDGKIEWIEPPMLRFAEAAQKDEGDDTSNPWIVSIAKYVGDDISTVFEDAAVSPKTRHTVEGLNFDLADLTTESGKAAKVKAAFKFNSKGSVAVEGELTPIPLSLNMNLDVKAVELMPLQPYFADKLNITIRRGQVALKGNAQLREAPPDKKEGNAGLSGGFTGQTTIGNFSAVDKSSSAEFLRWKSFYVGKADIKFGPESVSIGEVALSDFFARVVVSPEGQLNLLQIVRDEKSGAKPAEASSTQGTVESSDGKATAPVAVTDKPVIPIKINKLTLQGGSVRFSDNFIKPNYSANLQQIAGSVTGLSSAPDSQANLELRGNYDKVAPLNITARINPLAAKPSLDLQADVKGIELTTLSAYAEKYAGYEIDKGKLSVSVKYKIENDQLEAENQILLDQLTFGNEVDSPDAVKLPVRLAVSLLKNRRGEIDLNLPVSGSLDDPQFSIGSVVFTAIGNLLAKAITSPFALIGAAFGGGEELSSIEFDYGSAALTPDAEKRLGELSQALIDKPDLDIEITGRVDPEQDIEGVKRARIDRKVRALKRRETTQGSTAASGAPEAVEVSAEEYPALLERVYRAEEFPKPRNMIGMVTSLPVEEMEKLILAHSTVDDDDLRALGDRRAKAARDWLVKHDVPGERIFMLPSKIAKAGEEGTQDGEKGKNSRADFSLKLK